MKCERCGGRLKTTDSAADVYQVHRKRVCENCGRVVYTSERENVSALYALKTIRNEQRATGRKSKK